MSRDQILAAPVFLAAMAPWILLRIRRFGVRARVVVAVAVAAAVYPLGVAMQWAGVDNPGAIRGRTRRWFWTAWVELVDTGHGRHREKRVGGRTRSASSSAPLLSPFGILFDLTYRRRMAADPQSQAWLDDAALFRWNRRRTAQ